MVAAVRLPAKLNRGALARAYTHMHIHAGNETFEKLGTLGTSANLLVYLTQVFHMRSVDAATLLNGLNGTTSLAPIIGAFLSDAYLGRYLALAIASVASLIVSAAIHLQSTPLARYLLNLRDTGVRSELARPPAAGRNQFGGRWNGIRHAVAAGCLTGSFAYRITRFSFGDVSVSRLVTSWTSLSRGRAVLRSFFFVSPSHLHPLDRRREDDGRHMGRAPTCTHAHGS
jgi:dipeptide/tripeptide permease